MKTQTINITFYGKYKYKAIRQSERGRGFEKYIGEPYSVTYILIHVIRSIYVW